MEKVMERGKPFIYLSDPSTSCVISQGTNWSINALNSEIIHLYHIHTDCKCMHHAVVVHLGRFLHIQGPGNANPPPNQLNYLPKKLIAYQNG